MTATARLSLYEYGDDLEYVRQLLDESEGELTPAIEELLAQATDAFEAKAERVALFIREQQATAKGVRDEADRLDARAKALNRAADSLKAYLLREMCRTEKTRIEGQRITLRVQLNPPGVKCPLTSEQLATLACVPECQPFIRTVPASYAIDAKAVLAAFKARQSIPITEVEITQGQSLRLA